MNNEAVIIYDGSCFLCNGLINWIIRFDSGKYFRFTSLQSTFAQNILVQVQKQSLSYDSVLLFENGRIYSHSSAVLQIIKHLKGWVQLFLIFWIIPRPIRDLIYNFIANHRYRWFGRSSECILPPPELKDRFIE